MLSKKRRLISLVCGIFGAVCFFVAAKHNGIQMKLRYTGNSKFNDSIKANKLSSIRRKLRNECPRGDGDCRLYPDYCSGGCDCIALGHSEKDPDLCDDPVHCLRNPCEDKVAVCNENENPNQCEVRDNVCPHGDIDCRLYSYMCDGKCECWALGLNQLDPKCINHVACFANPCEDKEAVCNERADPDRCVVQAT